MSVKRVYVRWAGFFGLVVLMSTMGGLSWALQPKEDSSYLGSKAFFLPELSLSMTHVPLSEALDELPNKAAWEQHRLAEKAAGGIPAMVYVDSRSGTTSSLILSEPILPGEGVGNRIRLKDFRRRLGLVKAGGDSDSLEVTGDEVIAVVRQYIREHRGILGIEDDEVDQGVAGRANRELWHFGFPQTFQGIPVRHGRIVGAINNGNLVLIGAETWASPRGTSTRPKLTAAAALEAGFAHAGGRSALDEILSEPRLEIVPLTTSNSGIGRGYRHLLTWTFSFQRQGEGAIWQVTVDAQKGEVLSFEDTNHYLDGQTTGGAYPITATEICPTNGQCGVMQSVPMPFADTGLPSPNNFTNSAGIVDSTANVTTTLSGDFVNINDNCGNISVSGTNGTIEMGGVNGDHDCDVGSGGSAGNTPASRTAFYELNKLIEMARGWLPNNNWIQNQITANVNINNNCNAFWNGSTVNFYTSGGGCLNTGELAGVFDHEWGHGLDDNDTLGQLSNSSEGYADIAGIYRLHDSCVGHGFNVGGAGVCGLTSDGTGPNRNESQTGGVHCATDCSGVRDADYLRHNPNTPDTPLNFVCSECLSGGGPCGRQVHCAAAPVRQAAWDLVTQDLPFDSQTNFVIGNKLFYQGSGAVNTWYSCSCGSSSSGCGSGSGYLQWLAADDDDGNISNGTPHMEEIFDAFNRHGIACASPTPQNSGCSGGPTTAPTLSVSAGENSATLNWSSVTGASEYWVFRTEGHAGCDFGKALIAEVGSTSFTDTEVAGEREYWYSVMAADNNDACFTALSNCANVTPAAPGANAPTVTITAPADGSSHDQGDPITFTGTAVDPQDGDISASIVWSSSIDGTFGAGASVVTSSLSLGSHTITASATDSDSFTGIDQISIDVVPACNTVLYETDFESDDGGWIDGASTCTTGTFIRGTPDFVADGGVTTQPSGAAGGTFAWFTQNNGGGVGTDDVDNGTCETLSPSVNAGAGNAVTVFVDYFHGQRDANDDPNDGFSIELVNADTGAVLDTLVSIGDVTNNAAWTATFSSASASTNVQLRVRASDAPAGGDLVEGGIDNVRICSAGPPPPECTVDADCDNGLFCDGVETCNTGTGICEPGTPPDCDDGVSCTVDSCNEATDSCDNTPNDGLCDNGLFCDGAETCDAFLGCQAGTPVDCNDGVSCTIDACNEGTDSCDNVPDDAVCDNGLFCDGSEFCDVVLDCQDGPDPCSGSQTCNETDDVCEGGGACSHSTGFESGADGWTQGADSCSTGSFIVGTPDATAWQVGGGNPGQAFFTANNPGGVGTDDVDNGTCEALSPTVDCNGQPTADVSLDYFHGQRDAGDDGADGFTIEVLNDGTVVDTIVAIGDVTNNAAWTSVSTTVVSPGDIQVRVRATDAPGGGDIVEGGIDNVVIAPGGPPPTCTYEEGFEAGGLAGWSNSPASTCSTGDYVQGNPTNPAGGFQIVGSHTGAGSLFTAVNSSAGVDDVDSGNCILDSPALASPAGEASTLSVWYWHGQRDNNDDPAGDFFVLEYSLDGGSTWSTLASNDDSPSTPTWAEASASIPAGSDVRVRVQCSDGAPQGDLVECGIDDVSICN